MRLIYPEGATPLDHEELLALIPPHITLQSELNQWEQNNILLAERWAFKQKEILSGVFVQKLHQKMFNKTWKWAGHYRRSGKNIGIDWPYVSVEVVKLCEDVLCQLTHESYSVDEIAARFHHRLVWIHPFPNGNGRHARLMADLFLVQNQRPRFSWGRQNVGESDLYNVTPIRKRYIQALRQADQYDYALLMEVARS